jgi:hypothetical protein
MGKTFMHGENFAFTFDLILPIFSIILQYVYKGYHVPLQQNFTPDQNLAHFLN